MAICVLWGDPAASSFGICHNDAVPFVRLPMRFRERGGGWQVVLSNRDVWRRTDRDHTSKNDVGNITACTRRTAHVRRGSHSPGWSVGCTHDEL